MTGCSKETKRGIFDIRLDYARSLKYQGKYKQAMDELNAFVSIAEDGDLKNEAKWNSKAFCCLRNFLKT